MKIRDILSKGHPILSFEVFPPKQNMPFEPVKEVVSRLSKLNPAFISVTYGASGNAQANTVEVARAVQDCGTSALAHLTCLTATPEHIQEELTRLNASHIENILCLRGDLPQGNTPQNLFYHHAVDLVRVAHERGDFCLGGACYPECHPECAHLADDIAHLKAKVEAGLDFLTTQMFFDNNIFYRYLAKLRDAGITIPILAGIMPVTHAKQIARICKLSGTDLPSPFKVLVDRFGDQPDSMLSAGVAYAVAQIIDLIANGVQGIHVYTMNNPLVAERIHQALTGIIA